MRTQVEAEGNSIDEAIEKGLAELGVPRERVQVDILQDAKRRLFGFGGQKARVRVSLRGAGKAADGRAPAAPTPVPAVSEPGPDGDQPTAVRRAAAVAVQATAPTDAAEVARAAGILRDLLRHMEIEASVEEEAASAEPVLRIQSEAGGLLIGRHGQTLDALEYLVNRILSQHEERRTRVTVDCEGYRERRRRELADTATRLAERVKQRGKAQTMEALNPRDRRTVHLVLAEAGVATRSVGQGYLRRIVIVPAREPRA